MDFDRADRTLGRQPDRGIRRPHRDTPHRPPATRDLPKEHRFSDAKLTLSDTLRGLAHLALDLDRCDLSRRNLRCAQNAAAHGDYRLVRAGPSTCSPAVAVVLVRREHGEAVVTTAEDQRLRAHARDVRRRGKLSARDLEAGNRACRLDEIRRRYLRQHRLSGIVGHGHRFCIPSAHGHFNSRQAVRHFHAAQFAAGSLRLSVIRSFSRRSIASASVAPTASATAEHPDWMSIVPASIQASPTLC